MASRVRTASRPIVGQQLRQSQESRRCFRLRAVEAAQQTRAAARATSRAHQTRSERAVSPRERRNRCASRRLRFPPAVSGSGGCLPKGKFRCWFPDSRRRLPLRARPARPARPAASLQCDREKSGGNRWADPWIPWIPCRTSALPRPLPGPAPERPTDAQCPLRVLRILSDSTHNFCAALTSQPRL